MEDSVRMIKGPLEKAYSFENEAQFKAFILSSDEEERKVLFKLMADSERHKAMLEDIAKKLGIELEKKVEEFTDRRIFNELYSIEKSVKALYDELINNFGELLGENVEILKRIAEDEDMHVKLVEKFVDRTMRII
ncbi:MAG: hypothetical protein ABWW66_04795 [Archaeoglobaceae archaeon]